MPRAMERRPPAAPETEVERVRFLTYDLPTDVCGEPEEVAKAEAFTQKTLSAVSSFDSRRTSVQATT